MYTSYMTESAVPCVTERDTTYTASVARTREELEELRELWERLSVHLNVDLEYYLTVNDSFAAGGDSTVPADREAAIRPYVVSLFAGDEPVGMLIGRLETGRLELKLGYHTLLAPRVRSIVICYGGILGAESPHAAEALLDTLRAALSAGEADVAYLHMVRTDAPIFRLARTTPGFLCRDHLLKSNRHYRLVLPATFEEYLASRSRNTRENIRRYAKRLVKKYGDRLRIVRYTSEADLDRIRAYIAANPYRWDEDPESKSSPPGFM